MLTAPAVIACAATPLVNLIGDQAPLVVSFNDIPSLVKNWGESPWAKTWEDEQVRKFFAPLHEQMKYDELEQKLKAETGHTLGELIGFASGDAVIAFTTAEIDFEGENVDDNVPLVIAVELGDNADKVQKLLEEDRKKNPQNAHETEEFAGATLNIETTNEDGQGPGKSFWTITDGVWIVGFHKETVLGAIDALKKGGVENAFGKSDTFMAAREKAGKSQVSLFVNFRPIIAKAQEEIAKSAAKAEQPNPFLTPTAIIPALGLDAWNTLYLNVNFTDEQTVATGGFTFSEERGLLKMFSYGTGPVATPAFVPAKWITVSTGKFSLKNFYNGLEEMIGAYNPGVLGMGQMYLQQFNQQVGIDIKRDFFGSFGADMISAYAPRPGASASKTPSLEELDQFLAFSLDNSQAFTNALDAITKAAGPQAEKNVTKREYLGTTISTIAMPAQPGTPARSVSYAIAKNYFMVSIGSPAALESALQEGPSYWERREVKHALSQIPGDASTFSYQDTGALIGSVFQTFVQLGKNAGGAGGVPVDPSAAPDIETISKYWGDGVGYMQRDRGGYFFKSTLEYKK